MNGCSSAAQEDWREGKERERAMQLLMVARRYYEDGMSQDQIGHEIGYSRPTISRMLEEARRLGIVEVRIAHPLERIMFLEKLIKDRYNVKHVRVTTTSSPNGGVADVGRAAAELLDGIVRPEMTVGLSNGRTHMAMIDALQPEHPLDVTFVQMVGSLGGNDQLIDSPELCRRFATAYGSTYRVLNAPLLAPNPQTALTFMSEPTIAATLRIAASANIAVIGIGSGLRRPSGVFTHWLTPTHVQMLHRRGAVGHVLGHFIDRDGNVVESPFEEVVIGLSPSRLREIPEVICLGAGANKAPGFAAALHGGLINSVILDFEAAQALAYLPEAART